MNPRFLPLLLVAAFCAGSIRAEVPLLTPDVLQRDAKHIVTGKVQRVYTTEKQVDKSYVDTLYAVEVVVSAVEKGEGIAADQVIFAKAWQMKKRARGWAGPSGQDFIPKPGQVVKLYLTGDNGSYDALSPNGIHALKQE